MLSIAFTIAPLLFTVSPLEDGESSTPPGVVQGEGAELPQGGEGVELERARVLAILEEVSHHGLEIELAETLVATGATVHEARERILGALEVRPNLLEEYLVEIVLALGALFLGGGEVARRRGMIPGLPGTRRGPPGE